MSRPYTMAEINRLAGEWPHCSVGDLATRYGRTEASIRMVARRHRNLFPSKHPGRNVDKAGVIALVAAGYSRAETAKRMGCSARFVGMILRAE